MRSGTRGWMAIAERDSLYPRDLKKAGKLSTNSPMGSFISKQENAAELLTWAYTDNNGLVGFPEIALYPYKKHKGVNPIVRTCKTVAQALSIMSHEAKKDNLNYLPLATFTQTAMADMVGGLFTTERLGDGENSFSPRASSSKIHEYLDKLQRDGIDLPFYGHGTLSFDSRTGFFILPQIIPKDLMVGSVPYSTLALPLDTPRAKSRVLNYMLLFRTVVPAHFMKLHSFGKELILPRAIVLNRPQDLKSVFEDLELDIPEQYKAPLLQSKAMYQKGAARKTRKSRKNILEYALHFNKVWNVAGAAASASAAHKK